MANLPPYSHLRFDPDFNSGPHSPNNNLNFGADQYAPAPSTTSHPNTSWHWTPQFPSSSIASYHPTDVPLYMNSTSSSSYPSYPPLHPQPQIRPPIAIQLSPPPPPSPPSFVPDPHINAAQESISTTQQQRVREKRHQCNMCYKAFDRPSTLKKHMLVHTGEKAYACDHCGRRFGVASNLNRHVRRCGPRSIQAGSGFTSALTPELSHSDTSPPPRSSSTASPPQSASASPSADSHETGPIRRERPRISTIDAAGGDTAPSHSSSAPRPKRRRRAPSPVQWIPASLQKFSLTPYKQACPVPLAPVLSSEEDERDSFSMVSQRPYHPDEWTGKLPGPAALLEQELNRNLGRVLIF